MKVCQKKGYFYILKSCYDAVVLEIITEILGEYYKIIEHNDYFILTTSAYRDNH